MSPCACFGHDFVDGKCSHCHARPSQQERRQAREERRRNRRHPHARLTVEIEVPTSDQIAAEYARAWGQS